MKEHTWFRWSFIVFLSLTLLAGQSWATYRWFASRFPGGNDFYARWANGCALVRSGRNPYSDDVTLEAQVGMHGRPAEAGEDLVAFAYPLYALFFFWPLCFIQAYEWVQAIWMTLMLYALLAGVVLTARITNWKASPWLWGVTLVWSVLNYPHARALILGQMATLVFLGLAVALWALNREKDVWAGAALAITTIKPQMSFLVIPWILWWTAWRRRWGTWAGLSLAMMLLVAVSLVLVPTWTGDFLEDVRDYSHSWTKSCKPAGQSSGSPDEHQGCEDTLNYGSLTWIVTRHYLKLGPAAEIAGIAAFALYTLWVTWQERQAGWSGFLWVTGLILIVTNFVAPRTATTHYSMLLLPLFAWFARLKSQPEEPDRWIVVGTEVTLLVGQWTIFLTTLRGNFETTLVYLPFPVLMLLVHLLSRRNHGLVQ